jgi:hypothetical protein
MERALRKTGQKPRFFPKIQGGCSKDWSFGTASFDAIFKIRRVSELNRRMYGWTQ